MLNALRRRGEKQKLAERLYEGASLRSRDAVFYREFAVPDTFDGRFDLLTFHTWLLLEEIDAREERELAQAFVDALFTQFDEGLREQGAGDMGMGRRMKKIADAFYGRLEAYRGAASEFALAEAIARNLYRGESHGVEPAQWLAKYAGTARTQLAKSRIDSGELDFGPLPGRA
jgi:cytochrome b pre-mRNA-processing protein 3